MCFFGGLIGWINYFTPILIVLFFIYYLIVLRKKERQIYQENAEKSISYEKEMVGLLREIRDSLNK